MLFWIVVGGGGGLVVVVVCVGLGVYCSRSRAQVEDEGGLDDDAGAYGPSQVGLSLPSSLSLSLSGQFAGRVDRNLD
jgi:hypothetical protein